MTSKTLWKNQNCSNCYYFLEGPKQQGVVNLKAPKVFLCRRNPPTPIVAIGQTPDGNTVPIPIGSMYPIIDPAYPACSLFEFENKKGDLPDFKSFMTNNAK